MNDPSCRCWYEGAIARPEFGLYGFGKQSAAPGAAPEKPDKYLTDPAPPVASYDSQQRRCRCRNSKRTEAEPVARLDFGSSGLRWVWLLTTPAPEYLCR